MSYDGVGLGKGHWRQNQGRDTIPLVGWSLTLSGLCGLSLFGGCLLALERGHNCGNGDYLGWQGLVEGSLGAQHSLFFKCLIEPPLKPCECDSWGHIPSWGTIDSWQLLGYHGWEVFDCWFNVPLLFIYSALSFSLFSHNELMSQEMCSSLLVFTPCHIIIHTT